MSTGETATPAGTGAHSHRSPAARSQRAGDARSSRTASTSPPEAPPIRHKHPGEEIIYVLEGLLEYQVDGQDPTTLQAGEVFFVPAETVHAVKNVGGGNAPSSRRTSSRRDSPARTGRVSDG
jgi:quercetin dioxygenase-like cupin family protein